MPFGMGAPELIIVMVIVMIVFGVGRLPEIGGAMGKAIREFRSTVSGKSEDPEDREAVESKPENGKRA